MWCEFDLKVKDIICWFVGGIRFGNIIILGSIILIWRRKLSVGKYRNFIFLFFGCGNVVEIFSEIISYE